ncbi:hypothetical protein SRHO_G00050170 [Serrasalmus rhombeus]
MVQWRLQILMERERVKEEDMQELQRLRKLEKELQLKELGEREKERKETERQPSTRKALRGSARDGEIRGMEEIIREKEMEILRCRDRINQLKREKVKEKHEKSIEKSFMRERNYGFRLLKTSQGIMTLAQYEQAKRESLQKKENRRLALETRMRDWSNNRVETTPRKEEKKQELEAKRQEENKKEAEKKAEEKEAEKKAEEKEVEKKAEEKKEKKKWMKPMTSLFMSRGHRVTHFAQ